ncbi:MAG: transcription-repair coupling factor, partial [Myxococcales bacterium]|nr:transcription-repair coupling factor [Myxococcales bacterium]
SVRTHIAQFGDAILREGIESELRRGGQVYFVHNRVSGIDEIAAQIQEVVPEAKVAIGHAQMSDGALEKVMLSFVNREADVLVSTTIIESGLDIGSANTIFINRADAFGLAQLYQLRGRVGRGRERGFCYLLVPKRKKLQKDASRRLEVIRSHTELGSGLYIAQHDLDIRGAGDLLGKDQSGQIRNVGYDLFCELLEEAIQEQRGEPADENFEPEVKIPVSAYFPETYIPDEGLRLLFYKRLSMARDNDELDDVMSELVDRFGRPTVEVANLREIVALKVALTQMGIESLEAGPSAVVLRLSERCRLSPKKVVGLVQREQGRILLREDMTLIRYLSGKESSDIIAACRETIRKVRQCLA